MTLFQCPSCVHGPTGWVNSSGRTTNLFFAFICVCVQQACISTHDSICMCVWNDTFPSLIFRTHLREWVYPLPWLDPAWLTRRNSLTPSSSFHSSNFSPQHSNFLVHWLNFPPLMEYRGCEAKSSKGFYGVFHRYIGLVDYSISHACHVMEILVHANIQKIQTLKYANMPLILYVFHDFHNKRILYPRFPVDRSKLWNISRRFDE